MSPSHILMNVFTVVTLIGVFGTAVCDPSPQEEDRSIISGLVGLAVMWLAIRIFVL